MHPSEAAKPAGLSFSAQGHTAGQSRADFSRRSAPGCPRTQPPLALAAPRSPARKKAQTAPPPQPPPPPPPPALSDELPWGDLTLNKCLVLASLVALLGSAFQLCRGEPHTWLLLPGSRDTPRGGSVCPDTRRCAGRLDLVRGSWRPPALLAGQRTLCTPVVP